MIGLDLQLTFLYDWKACVLSNIRKFDQISFWVFRNNSGKIQDSGR